MDKRILNDDWEVCFQPLEYGGDKVNYVSLLQKDWFKCNLPCDVRMVLLENCLISEPSIASNCFESEWVEYKSWWFRKKLFISEEDLQRDSMILNVQELDCEADIFVNNILLGHHKSVFYPFQKKVNSFLVPGENTLMIRVTSGNETISDLDVWTVSKRKSVSGVYDRPFHKGDLRRIFLRKPQCVFGWDHAPRVVSCGIMGDVSLTFYDVCQIKWAHIVTKKIENTLAALQIEFEIVNLDDFRTMDAELTTMIRFNGLPIQEINTSLFLKSGINYEILEVEISNPLLWWPNGMGEPNLYTLEAKIKTRDQETNLESIQFGIRTLELDQSIIDHENRKFVFKINDIEVFCKGANWVPVDTIYARITEEKYINLIETAQKANMNMLRVWGGGMYEKDIFYKTCNEKGILVWQDFMFACSVYPDHLEWFATEAENEMDYQTKRLRNHPALALWCGNNEVQTAIVQDLLCNEEPYEFFGGMKCFNEIAPKIIYNNCKEIPYWNSSPYGGNRPDCDQVGDKHEWSYMINDNMERRLIPQLYDQINTKFASEYGFPGPCCKTSTKQYFGNVAVDMNSEIWKLHTNTYEDNTVRCAIRKFVSEQMELSVDEYLLYGGICQGIIYGYSLEALQIKENCYGALLWMYADAWGEVGWSIIDYYSRFKPAYYFVKRALMPVKLILREADNVINIYGVNNTSEEIFVSCQIGYESYDGLCNESFNDTLYIEHNSRKCIYSLPKREQSDQQGYYYVRPLDNKVVLPAISSHFSYNRDDLVKTKFTLEKTSEFSFVISADKFASCVGFNLSDCIQLSDQFFDMLPNESREIRVSEAFDIDLVRPFSLSEKAMK